MDIGGNETVWQVAAGDANRNYAQICMDWDVIVIGPGQNGHWVEERGVYGKYEGRKPGWFRDLEKFQERIRVGDWVVLRVGTKRAYAVGQVKSEYFWFDDFGDVDGWDLQHVRRVQWHWKSESGEVFGKGEGTKTGQKPAFKWGATIHEMSHHGRIWDWFKGKPNEQASKRSLVQLPKSCEDGKKYDDQGSDSVLEQLRRKSGTKSLDSIRAALDDSRSLGKWYYKEQAWPSEAEGVAHLIVPVLLSIGWSKRQLAMEWQKTDVALFRDDKREKSEALAIVEAKRWGASTLSALDQAKKYVRKIESEGMTKCNRVIVADGICYTVYGRRAGDKEFRDYPSAHLNLNRLRSEYPILSNPNNRGDQCLGAAEALSMMMPNWRPTTTG